jgi:hypothetical protein
MPEKTEVTADDTLAFYGKKIKNLFGIGEAGQQKADASNSKADIEIENMSEGRAANEGRPRASAPERTMSQSDFANKDGRRGRDRGEIGKKWNDHFEK